jgi:hypothetical protein
MSELDWFFRSPREAAPASPGETVSCLYPLRRDIDTCFGFDPNTGARIDAIDQATGAPIDREAIRPGTMAILAGIDLLGQFLVGTDQTRGDGRFSKGRKRFKRFTKRYLGFSSLNAELLYQLRNALLDGCGLHSERRDKNGCVTTYNFILARGMETVIRQLKDTDHSYEVDARQLRQLFELAVLRYELDLRDTSHQHHEKLRPRFDAMFPKYARPMSSAGGAG